MHRFRIDLNHNKTLYMAHPPAGNGLERKIIKRMKDTIRKYGMLERGDTVIAAVSGGVDSMVLLHALNNIREEFDITLVVCHLNHGLRGKESDRDFEFVKKACSDLGLTFEGRRLRTGELRRQTGSLQEAARIKRYKFLEDAAKKHSAGKIALGHTLDDQAETVLMRFIKGSSITGLTGIPTVRGPFIRPLIEIKKEDLVRLAEVEGIGHVEDSSNQSVKYLRNDLRLNLIPFIKKYNPNLTETLVRMAAIFSEDEKFLDNLAGRAMSGVIIKKSQTELVLDRARLTRLHRALAARVFLKTIEMLGKISNTYNVHIRSFLNIVGSESVSSSISLPDGLRVITEWGRVIITTRRPKEIKPFDKAVNVPGTTRLAGGRLLRATVLDKPPITYQGDGKIAYFDYSAINGQMNVRSIKPGDRMTPFGMTGSKKLKEVLIEKKVPRLQRAGIPVIYSGKNILWAVGVRQSELFKVKKNTKKILKIEYTLR